MYLFIQTEITTHSTNVMIPANSSTRGKGLTTLDNNGAFLVNGTSHDSSCGQTPLFPLLGNEDTLGVGFLILRLIRFLRQLLIFLKVEISL